MMNASLLTVDGRPSSGMPAVAAPRRRWALTQDAFDRLLAALGEDRERAGERYVEIRSNLVRFFEWRACPFPEEHADEAMNRVAKRLEEGEEIRDPSGYCIGVARRLLLEINKERAREQQALSELAISPVGGADASESEWRTECLRACLENLPADSRELIVEYYQVNALRMRALRIRETLQRLAFQHEAEWGQGDGLVPGFFSIEPE
jgi:DNA-directed RNA polymerase specialized sigma24 family protein